MMRNRCGWMVAVGPHHVKNLVDIQPILHYNREFYSSSTWLYINHGK